MEAFAYRHRDGRERFRVRVTRSPAGRQAAADAEEVVVPADLRARLVRLDMHGLSRDDLVELGEDLGRLLLPPAARRLFERSRRELADLDRLRLLIRLRAVALADLPWEYVYLRPPDTRAGQLGMDGFVALDPRLSVVRHERLRQAPGTLEPLDPRRLRVVALLAGPVDPSYPPLRLDAERQAIARALRAVEAAAPTFVESATLEALEQALVDAVHVFHFAGHGMFEPRPGSPPGRLEGAGYVVLEGEGRRPFPYPAEKLALSLAGLGVRLAVLGACEGGRRDQVNAWTGVVPALVKTAGVPAVVGMQYTIGDDNAVQFSRHLYESLVDGDAVEAAVTAGRRAVFNRNDDGNRDWGAPVLYLRAERGVLFPAPEVAGGGASWTDVVARARQQSDRFLRELRGDPDAPGRFLAEAHVGRERLQRGLADFLRAAEPALVVVGDSGSGKTSLLSAWATELRQGGHAVFLYDCGGAVSGPVEGLLARDLELASPAAVGATLSELAASAVAAQRQVVIVFDGLNESPDAGTLLAGIDALVRALPAAGVKVVASCKSAAWRRLGRAQVEIGWDSYFDPDGGRVLTVGPFTPGELEEAYQRYRALFELRTPLARLSPLARESLADPLALRLVAEAHAGGAVPDGVVGRGLRVLQAYWQRRAAGERERRFLERLAASMLELRCAAVPLSQLAAHDPALKADIEAARGESAYDALVRGGVLAECADKRGLDDLVRFAHQRVASYVAARVLWERDRHGVGAHARRLAGAGTGHPLGWDVARTLVVLAARSTLFGELAESGDVELRQLAVEALVELHADDPPAALGAVRDLLRSGTTDSRITGLRAAYRMGADARQVFKEALVDGPPALRTAAVHALYLRWRRDPEFTWALLDDLAREARLTAPRLTSRALDAMAEVSAAIYVHHCDRHEVVRRTSDLWYRVLVERLHLRGLLPPPLERVFLGVVGAVFSRRVADTPLFSEGGADRLFSLPAVERARIRRVAAFTDPECDLAPAEDDLVALLGSDVLACSVPAGLVLAVHAYWDPEGTEPLARRAFASLGPRGRLNELAAFSVLLPDRGVAAAWVTLLEDFTRTVVDQHPDAFFGPPRGILAHLDLRLLPLGLAYAKVGGPMPYLEELLGGVLAEGDAGRLAGVVSALGPLGLFRPDETLRLLASVIDDVCTAPVREAVAGPLALMRVMDADAVDLFLRRAGADDELVRRVAAEADLDLAGRLVHSVGHYNSAVHQALFCPAMRTGVLAAFMEALADARSAQDFARRYRRVPATMVRQSGYRFEDWVAGAVAPVPGGGRPVRR